MIAMLMSAAVEVARAAWILLGGALAYRALQTNSWWPIVAYLVSAAVLGLRRKLP